MDAREDRVLHLAVADGRGHLMRAHLLRRLLADAGRTIDVVTTSRGRAGVPGRPGHAGRRCCRAASRCCSTIGIACSPTHGAPPRRVPDVAARPGARRRPAGAARRRRALHRQRFTAPCRAGPRGGAGDRGRTARRQRPRRQPLARGGAQLRRPRARLDERRVPPPARIRRRARVRADRPLAGAGGSDRPCATDRTVPPAAAHGGPAPRARRGARARSGSSGRDRLAAIDLNPHFRDPRLAARLEAALAARRNSLLRRVGALGRPPGLARLRRDFGDDRRGERSTRVGRRARQRWSRPAGPACRCWRCVGDQPEQALNLSQARAAGIQARAVDVATDAPAALRRGDRALTSTRRRIARFRTTTRAFTVSGATLSCPWLRLTKENHHATRPEDTDDGSGRWKPTTWQAAVATPTASSTASRGCSAICARRRDR